MIISNKNIAVISNEYLHYFNKVSGSRLVQMRGSKTLSKYLKFTPSHHIHEQSQCFCINDEDRVVNSIREKEKRLSIIQEGLIVTYPTEKVVNHFKKEFHKTVSPELVDANMPSSDQKVVDFLVLSDENVNVSPEIMVCLPAKDDADIKRLVKYFTDDFVKSGYYLMAYDIKDANDIKYAYVQFEAKYNDMLVELEDILYHVSPFKYLPKILKNGLVPYSKSQQFKYEDRIYLFNKCPQQQVYDYGTYKAVENKDVGFCVFKVLKTKLLNDPIFKDGKQRFYLDTAFSMTEDGTTDQTAVFTYGNIPKRILSKYYVEVKIDHGNIVSSETKMLK